MVATDCPLCCKQKLSYIGLKKHLAGYIWGSIPCSICDSVCLGIESLYTHLDDCHQESNTSELTESLSTEDETESKFSQSRSTSNRVREVFDETAESLEPLLTRDKCDASGTNDSRGRVSMEMGGNRVNDTLTGTGTSREAHQVVGKRHFKVKRVDAELIEQIRAKKESVSNIYADITRETITFESISDTESMSINDGRTSKTEYCASAMDTQLYIKNETRPRQITDAKPNRGTAVTKPEVSGRLVKCAGAGNFICGLCGSEFKSIFTLQEHASANHRIKQIVTMDCFSDKIKPSRADLKPSLDDGYIKEEFIENMEDEESYVMDKIGQSYKSDIQKCVSAVTKKEIEGTDNSTTCDICGKTFKSVIRWRKHKYIHGNPTEWPHECSTCLKRFTKKRELRQHILLVHSPGRVNKPGEDPGIPCKYCGKKFGTPARYKSHVDRIHLNLKPSVCIHCGKKFCNKSELAAHSAVHLKVKPAKCSYCERRFNSKKEVKRHEKVHTSNKSHVCDVCGKQYRMSFELKAHYRTHTGEKPYLCNICGAMFSLTGSLSAHRKYHTETKNFECQYCGKKFRTRGELYSHEKLHSKPFQCELCGRSFCAKYILSRHILAHVKDYRCHKCGVKFSALYKLRRHNKTDCWESLEKNTISLNKGKPPVVHLAGIRTLTCITNKPEQTQTLHGQYAHQCRLKRGSIPTLHLPDKTTRRSLRDRKQTNTSNDCGSISPRPVVAKAKSGTCVPQQCQEPALKKVNKLGVNCYRWNAPHSLGLKTARAPAANKRGQSRPTGCVSCIDRGASSRYVVPPQQDSPNESLNGLYWPLCGLECPLCCKHQLSFEELKKHLSIYIWGFLQCPVCGELLIGLEKLAQHLDNRHCETGDQISTTSKGLCDNEALEKSSDSISSHSAASSIGRSIPTSIKLEEDDINDTLQDVNSSIHKFRNDANTVFGKVEIPDNTDPLTTEETNSSRLFCKSDTTIIKDKVSNSLNSLSEPLYNNTHINSFGQKNCRTQANSIKIINSRTTINVEGTAPNNINTGYMCEYCDIVFVSLDNLQEHATNAHNMNNIVVNVPKELFPEVLPSSKRKVVKIHGQTITLQPDLLSDSDMKQTSPDGQASDKKKTQEKMCHICGGTSRRNFPSKRQMYVDKESDQRVICSVCVACFGDEDLLARHGREMHAGLEVFRPHLRNKICQLCGKVLFTHNISRHMKSSHGIDGAVRSICQDCGKVNCSETLHKTDLSYTCKVCGENFSTVVALRSHSSSHVEISNENEVFSETLPRPKVSVCKICGESRSNMRKHMVTCHKETSQESVACPDCGDICSKNKLKAHRAECPKKESDEAVACPDCGKMWGNKKKMKLHRDRVHLRILRFVCHECGKKFFCKSGLNTHLLTHSKVKKHECKFCSKRFSSKTNLDTHESKHLGKKESPFICSYCGRLFTNKLYLQNHERLHKGERPYACKICGAKFAGLSTLYSHKYTHTDERPHHCNMCGKSFKTTAALYFHKQQHSKQHKCDVCCRMFSYVHNLKQHLLTHTKDYSCSGCGAQFKSLKKLQVHERHGCRPG
uniref:(California timema) hypothetical protein n=1 Tax=Timema californicum TaxID=61474 RepID=A0A7R9J980_TIMCA|nr:unnamed protein product [Timema californicum]